MRIFPNVMCDICDMNTNLIPKDYSRRQSDWLRVELNTQITSPGNIKSNMWGVYRHSPELMEVFIGTKGVLFKNDDVSHVDIDASDIDVTKMKIHFKASNCCSLFAAPLGIIRKVRAEIYKNMSSKLFFSEYDFAVLEKASK